MSGELIVGAAVGALAAIAIGLVLMWMVVAVAIGQAARGGGLFGALGGLYARGSQWQIAGLTYYSAHFIALKAGGDAGRVPLPFLVYLIPVVAGIAGGWLAARQMPGLPTRQVAIATGVAYAVFLWILRPMFSLSVMFAVLIPGGFSTLFFAAPLGVGFAWIGAAIHRGAFNA